MKAEWSPRSEKVGVRTATSRVTHWMRGEGWTWAPAPVVFKRTAGADRQPLMARARSASASVLETTVTGTVTATGEAGRDPLGAGTTTSRTRIASLPWRHHEDRSSRGPRSHGDDERTMTTRLFLQGSVQRLQGVDRPRTRALCFENHSENEDQNRQCASRASLACYRAEVLMTPLPDDRGSKELSVRRITPGTETP